MSKKPKVIHYVLGANKSVIISIRPHKWNDTLGFSYKATPYIVLPGAEKPQTLFNKQVTGFVEGPEDTSLEEMAGLICDVALVSVCKIAPDFVAAALIDLLETVQRQHEQLQQAHD